MILQRRHPGQNFLGVHVEAFNWKSVQHVSLDKEGVHTYRMKDEVDGIRHRLVVDIKLKNHVKQVTFRSGLLVTNQTLQPMQLALSNATKSKRVSEIWHIGMKNYCLHEAIESTHLLYRSRKRICCAYRKDI